MAAAELPKLVTETVSTPIGALRLVTVAGRLCAAEFADCEGRLAGSLRRHYGGGRNLAEPGRVPAALKRALDRYFSGALDAIGNLDIDPAGTPFQQAVWMRLRAIRAGTTLSYAALAAAIGRPKAVRAVGHANGANPISLIVPCHRLVGSNGSLTGYGGGLHRKQWLLAHEARFARPQGRVPGGG